MKPKDRSSSVRKLKKRLSYRVKTYTKRKKKRANARCAICKKPLAGVDERQKTRTKRTVLRKYGGVLCPSCLERVIKLSQRVKQGTIRIEDVSLKYLDYVKQLSKA